jgi:hypothetical protein
MALPSRIGGNVLACGMIMRGTRAGGRALRRGGWAHYRAQQQHHLPRHLLRLARRKGMREQRDQRNLHKKGGARRSDALSCARHQPTSVERYGILIRKSANAPAPPSSLGNFYRPANCCRQHTPVAQ